MSMLMLPHPQTRYCKAILERYLMEECVEQCIVRIDDQYLPRLIEKHPEKAPEVLYNEATQTLEDLTKKLPIEIGYLGLGPAIVEMIMHRNIEKMKLINHVMIRDVRKLRM
ncbi:unnamed protein product [Amoebophrya sp. A25]|nr:unnamed protein product [Amoebophrya sp. A25]|eukprot:GSA25T00009546001.1